MKFLYAADLPGDVGKYRGLVDLAAEEKVQTNEHWACLGLTQV